MPGVPTTATFNVEQAQASPSVQPTTCPSLEAVVAEPSESEDGGGSVRERPPPEPPETTEPPTKPLVAPEPAPPLESPTRTAPLAHADATRTKDARAVNMSTVPGAFIFLTSMPN